MPQQERHTTSLTPQEMGRGWGPFVLAHEDVAGAPPSVQFLESVLSIIGVENAGGRSINNHNWGNIMAGPSWRQAGNYWAHPSPTEGQPAYFRAYPSHRAGARDFWRVIYKRPGVLQGALAGDVPAMVRELYASRYVVASSPGELERYTKAATDWRDTFHKARVFYQGPDRWDVLGSSAHSRVARPPSWIVGGLFVSALAGAVLFTPLRAHAKRKFFR